MISIFKKTKAALIFIIVALFLLAVAPTSAQINEQPRQSGLPAEIKTNRGMVKVTQMPSSRNGFTMILRFDDDRSGGAAWYDIMMQVSFGSGVLEELWREETLTIQIRTYIDGVSDLILKADTARWHHHKWAVPGRHGRNNYPTIINGVQWYPDWPDEQDNPDEPRGEQKSDAISGLPLTLPQQEVDVQIRETSCVETEESLSPPQWVSIAGERGPSGYALRFDGASNFIRVPNHPSLEPEDEMTIEMWAYIDGDQSTNTRLLRKAGHMNAGYLLAADQTGDGEIQVRFDDNCETICAGSAKHADYMDQWHHLAGVYANDYVSFYLDGKLIGQHMHDQKKLTHSPVDLYIGHGAPGGSSEYFKGMADEVRIWNVVRTSQQIQANRYCSVPIDTPGLVAYWKFEEGAGEIAHDSTKNQNHGRLENYLSAEYRNRRNQCGNIRSVGEDWSKMSSWSDESRGVKMRLRVSETRFSQGKVPGLLVDFQNICNTRISHLAFLHENWAIELDGQIYRAIVPDPGNCADLTKFIPGTEIYGVPVPTGAIFVNAEQEWLEWLPGKHKVRIHFVHNETEINNGRYDEIRLVSNSVDLIMEEDLETNLLIN